jgi:hypothetical protein
MMKAFVAIEIALFIICSNSLVRLLWFGYSSGAEAWSVRVDANNIVWCHALFLHNRYHCLL